MNLVFLILRDILASKASSKIVAIVIKDLDYILRIPVHIYTTPGLSANERSNLDECPNLLVIVMQR